MNDELQAQFNQMLREKMVGEVTKMMGEIALTTVKAIHGGATIGRVVVEQVGADVQRRADRLDDPLEKITVELTAIENDRAEAKAALADAPSKARRLALEAKVRQFDAREAEICRLIESGEIGNQPQALEATHTDQAHDPDQVAVKPHTRSKPKKTTKS